MALSVAVRFELDGSAQTYQSYEYPMTIDALDDMVLENLVPDGRGYQLRLNNQPINDSVLHTAADNGKILVVQVITKPIKTQEEKALLVLKVIGSRPVKKHTLSQFPPNLSDLDDIILEQLVTDGSTYSLKVDGEPLTQKTFQQYSEHGQPIVVHVSKSGSSDTPSLPTVAIGQQSLSRMREPLNQIKTLFSNAQSTLERHGNNLMIEATKADMTEYTRIQEASIKLGKKDTNLGAEAEEVLTTMRESFRKGLSNLLETRSTVQHMIQIAFLLANAFAEGNASGVRLRMMQLEQFADKMSKRAEMQTAAYDALCTELKVKYDKYWKSRNNYGTASVGCGVGSGVVGVGSGAGGAAISFASAGGSLWTAGSAAVPAVAPVAGWFGTSIGATAGSAAIPAVASTLTPLGVIVLAGALTVAVASVALGVTAVNLNTAKNNTDDMADLTQSAKKNASANLNLWQGLVDNINVAKNAIEDFSVIGPEDAEIFGNLIMSAATALQSIQSSTDEYLVFVSECGCFPVTSNIKSVVGESQYRQIKDLMSVQITQPNNTRS